MKKIIFASAVLVFGLCSPIFATENISACTAEYVPVCGQPQMPKCPEGMACAQVMPQPKTYANACLLQADQATKIHEGSCESSRDSENTMKDQELVTWAYDKKLTMFENIDDFGYDRSLSRQEASAFAMRFAVNILGMTPITCTPENDTTTTSMLAHFYSDAHEIDKSLIRFIDQACGMKIMNGANSFFFPHHEITISETLAVLSRTLNGKQNEGTTPWYAGYKQFAEKHGIEISEKNLDTPITRGQFITWIKQLSTLTPSSQKTPLEGTWDLKNVTIEKKSTNVADKKIQMTLKGNNLSTRICNNMGGKVTFDGSIIKTKGLMSTMMYCEETMFIENAFQVDGASYVLSENDTVLTLTTKDGSTFVYHKTPVTLHIGEWKLTSFDSKAPATDIVLNVTADKLSVRFCNNMSGAYTIENGILHTEGMVQTLMYCNDENLMQMEGAFGSLDGASVKLVSEAELIHMYFTTKDKKVFQFIKK